MGTSREGVEADLFQRGWSRVRGRAGRAEHRASQAIRSAAQMVAAAQGGAPAVFKVIRDGGCRSPAQLRRQLAYVGNKATLVFDARGLLDGHRALGRREVDEAARRLAGEWRAGHPLRLGHTAHLLMSFPIGTPQGVAGAVAEAVCAGAFQRPGAHFDYVAALHTDRAHPHVHVIVNRHGIEGGLLTLRPDGPYSYQAFREAMVEQAAHHGLALEATRRLDRGSLTYAARDAEVRRARDRGQPPVERPRVGRDLESAVRAVARARVLYDGLALDARRSGHEGIAAELRRAGAMLAQGGVFRSTPGVGCRYASQAFVLQLKTLADVTQRVEERIAAAPPAARPDLERSLGQVLKALPHLTESDPPTGPSGALASRAQDESDRGRASGADRSLTAPAGVGHAAARARGSHPPTPLSRAPDPITAIADRLRHADPDAPAFASAREAAAFRQELERRLGSADAARLARGEAGVLSGVTDLAIDRLTLTKALMDARGVPEGAPVSRAVALDIAQAQLALRRERLGHERDGPVHG